MRVRVDRARCSGIGMCEMTAAAVFEVGADGLAGVLDEEPPEDARTLVEDAIANCPTGALSVQD